jgi:hypothetical protein
MARKMTTFSAELFELLSNNIKALGLQTRVQKMFGHEVHFLNGYMFAGASTSGINIHVGQSNKDAALGTESGVFSFEPLQGMAMKEYVLVGEEIYSDEKRFRTWLEKGAAYIESLPPKKKKR